MSTDYKFKMKDYRLKHGLSQEQMADKMGLTQQNYSAVERGLTQLSFKFLKQFKEATGVDLMSTAEEQPAASIPTDELAVLKFHHEQLAKVVIAQGEKIKHLEEQLRLMVGVRV